jgi:hypothetical protein
VSHLGVLSTLCSLLSVRNLDLARQYEYCRRCGVSIVSKGQAALLGVFDDETFAQLVFSKQPLQVSLAPVRYPP